MVAINWLVEGSLDEAVAGRGRFSLVVRHAAALLLLILLLLFLLLLLLLLLAAAVVVVVVAAEVWRCGCGGSLGEPVQRPL